MSQEIEIKKVLLKSTKVLPAPTLKKLSLRQIQNSDLAYLSQEKVPELKHLKFQTENEISLLVYLSSMAEYSVFTVDMMYLY